MKNLLSLLVLFVLFSCSSPSGRERAARPEKVGKLETQKADVAGFRFEVNGRRLDEANIPYGSSVTLVLEGVEGFKETDGKINFDAIIEVFNPKNERVVRLDKLFDESFPRGMPVEKFRGLIDLTLKCQSPIKMNETYRIVFTLKDRAGDTKISVSDNFSMVPAKGLSYGEKGLHSDGMFFHRNSEQEAYTENVLTPGDTLFAYCTGVTGMAPDNNMVWPDGAITLYTEKGESLAEFKDLYKDYEKEGVDQDMVKQLLTMHIVTPVTLRPKTKYYVVFYTGDKKSGNSLTARYDFVTK